MAQLNEEKCVACRAGAPHVTAEETEQLKPEIPRWSLIEEGGVRKLKREFRFANFTKALAFTNQVGGLAEAQVLAGPGVGRIFR